MITLLDEPAPRSPALVAVTMGRAYHVARHRAFMASLLAFVGVAIPSFAAVLYEMQRDRRHELDRFGVILAIAMLVVASACALWVRRIRLHGLETARRIVRDGAAFRATITKHRVHRYGTFIEITWPSGKGRLDLPRIELAGGEDVTVLVGEDDQIAAAIADLGVFLGERV